MYPKPANNRAPDLDRWLRRRVLRRVATKSDGWLTYCYTASSYAEDKARICLRRKSRSRSSALSFTNQLPIAIGPREKIQRPMKEWLETEWDFASWSQSTADSAIIGTVEEWQNRFKPT
ncbi:MAG: hypothetical protein CM1200mP41_32630 [Gammaproteobacteria bacterium]|nr:MAG: hypothetical protein CM1200mP41_32630 [Gammaproteobacteria bacterium]